MIHVSEKTKLREGRGKGEKEFYKPWIECRECNSMGTCVLYPDWKHGRTMHFLSQGEFWAYLILRWQDNVLDIREQFPLDKDDTLKIADAKGIVHPHNIDGNITMTTDLLVTFLDKNEQPYIKAYSVKNRRDDVFGDIDDPGVMRTVEKQRIEMAYWHLHNVQFENIFKEELNPVLASNIELVVQRFRLPAKYSKSDVLRFLIARKMIPMDMDHAYIQDRMNELLLEHQSEIENFFIKATEAKQHRLHGG